MTQREFPSSKDIAGVNMRVTAGSFRELHWHTADEWAIMLDGNCRITLLNPDGTIFIDDVSQRRSVVFPGWPSHIRFRGRSLMVAKFLLVFNRTCFLKTIPYCPLGVVSAYTGEVQDEELWLG